MEPGRAANPRHELSVSVSLHRERRLHPIANPLANLLPKLLVSSGIQAMKVPTVQVVPEYLPLKLERCVVSEHHPDAVCDTVATWRLCHDRHSNGGARHNGAAER